MRIKKVSSTTPTSGQIVNGYSTSTTDGYACDYVNEITQEIYSTDEVLTNKIWLGKPVYRKVITYSGDISSSYNTNIANFERLISLYGNAKLENTFWVQISNDNITANGVFCTLHLNSTGTTINVTKSSNSFYDGCIIIEYTKTTD